MAITAYSQQRFGDATVITVTSDLSGTIYYHWYADGVYVGRTLTSSRTFQCARGGQVRVDCLDTTDAGYDGAANAPDAWPARRTLWWVRSLDADVTEYLVEQKKGAGSWSTLGRVPAQSGRWTYSLLTDRLDDLAEYTWRVTPKDAAGRSGTALTIGPETIVRRPDAPSFSASYNESTQKVTFS